MARLSGNTVRKRLDIRVTDLEETVNEEYKTELDSQKKRIEQAETSIGELVKILERFSNHVCSRLEYLELSRWQQFKARMKTKRMNRRNRKLAAKRGDVQTLDQVDEDVGTDYKESFDADKPPAIERLLGEVEELREQLSAVVDEVLPYSPTTSTPNGAGSLIPLEPSPAQMVAEVISRLRGEVERHERNAQVFREQVAVFSEAVRRGSYIWWDSDGVAHVPDWSDNGKLETFHLNPQRVTDWLVWAIQQVWKRYGSSHVLWSDTVEDWLEAAKEVGDG